MRIFVSSSAMAGGSLDLDRNLIGEVADFARYLNESWGFPSSAVPKLAQAVSDFGTYLGEVANGGHSQFVGNAGAEASGILGNVVYLMELSGLEQNSAIAQRAKDWVVSNPAEAKAQTGFNGGISEDLAALDGPFFEPRPHHPPFSAIAGAIRSAADVYAAGTAEKAALQRLWAQAVEEWFIQNPSARAGIAQQVCGQVRDWFARPLRVGLALAAGWENAPRFVDFSYVDVKLDPRDTAADPATGTLLMFEERPGSKPGIAICDYQITGEGVTVSASNDGVIPDPIHVPMAKIIEVQNRAAEFRIAESVGLRWWRMGAPFSAGFCSLYERPGWEPGKFWLRWTVKNWAVKGSPEKSTFFKFHSEWSESLSQDELAALSVSAGLS